VFALAGTALVAAVAAPGIGAYGAGVRRSVLRRPAADPFAPLPARSPANIVFALDKPGTGETTVTAYIQILYSGTASDFSWVLPIDAVPRSRSGDRVFTQVAQLTRPSYGATTVIEGECKTDGRSTIPRPWAAAPVPVALRRRHRRWLGRQRHFRRRRPLQRGRVALDERRGPPVWLADNGFVVSDTARSIINEYVALNKYFVAVKLLSGQRPRHPAGGAEVRGPGSLCVPAHRHRRAGRHAGQPYVLGEPRGAVQLLRITLNQAKIDWLGGSQTTPRW
jgi:hypothetical protein